MVWTTLMMLDRKLSCERCDSLSDKMRSLVTGQTPRTTKSSNDIL